jgi:hypothetical protein
MDGWPAPLLKRRNIMADAEQELRQLLEQEGQRLYAHGAAIKQSGHQRHGAKVFDDAIQDVTNKLGNAGVDQLVFLAREYHHPDDLIVHLSNNPDRLEKLARMTPAEANTELACIEAQHSPHGRAQGGKEPAWRQAVKTGGRISRDDWRRNGGDDLKDDAEWSRQWDAEQRRRMNEGRRSGRFTAGAAEFLASPFASGRCGYEASRPILATELSFPRPSCARRGRELGGGW